jgi:hypothetical protein
MTALRITAGPYAFDARLEKEAAPKTCAAFEAAMPFTGQLVHVRWSGEGVWIPLSAIAISVLATKTTPATPHRARSSSTRAASAKRRFCWLTAVSISRPRWDNWPAIISLP